MNSALGICRAGDSQETSHDASKEAEERGNAGTQNTNIESVVAALATTITNVSTRGLTSKDLYAVQKAVAQLKTIMKDSRAKSRSNDTLNPRGSLVTTSHDAGYHGRATQDGPVPD